MMPVRWLTKRSRTVQSLQIELIDRLHRADRQSGSDRRGASLLYVAMTRAKQHLHLVQPLRFFRKQQHRHGDKPYAGAANAVHSRRFASVRAPRVARRRARWDIRSKYDAHRCRGDHVRHVAVTSAGRRGKDSTNSPITDLENFSPSLPPPPLGELALANFRSTANSTVRLGWQAMRDNRQQLADRIAGGFPKFLSLFRDVPLPTEIPGLSTATSRVMNR
jgi:hypothetical protein